MPKLIFEFQLPEEKEEVKIHQNAGAYYSALWDINEYLVKLVNDDVRKKIPKDEVIEQLKYLMSGVDL